MPEVGNTNFKIIGAPDHLAEHIEPTVLGAIGEKKRKLQQDIIPAELGVEEEQGFRLIETQSVNLINAKLQRLGIEAPVIKPVTYAKNPKMDNGEGYYDPLVGAVVFTNRGVATFDKYSTIAHGVSHLFTKNEARSYLSDQERHAPHMTLVSGVEVVGNREPLAGALEEGMATMDQVDFFSTYLQINHPQEYARRRQAAESRDIQEQIKKSMSRRLYGEISPLAIAPFIVLETHKKRIGKGVKIKPVLDAVGLKRYLFARKMCEVLGRSLAPADKTMSPEELILLGRDLIDRDRYLRTGDAHRKIVEAMGGGAVVADRKAASEAIHGGDFGRIGQQMIAQGGLRAKTIFAANANDPESIDEAMAMFRYVSPKPPTIEEGKPRELTYREWIEATPPAPIEPDRSNESPLALQGEALETPAVEVNAVSQAPVKSVQVVDSIPEPVPAEVEPTPAAEAEAPVVETEAPAVNVVEDMLPPIVIPPAENQSPTPRVEAREITSLAPEPMSSAKPKIEAQQNPLVVGLENDLRRKEQSLNRAEGRLAAIVSRHPGRETESEKAERLAIERYEDEIEDLRAAITRLNIDNS